ncbi:NRDE2-like protein [Nymphaea thermarum]|nr:NRDE2-like protein [Nymphaea thermarum]
MGREGDEEAEGKVEGEGTTSLFPLASAFPISGDRSSSGDSKPQWLYNPSFSFDVSKIHDSVGVVAYEPGPGSDEEKRVEVRERPSYDILESPSSSDAEYRERRRRKKGKKRRRSHEGVKDVTRKSKVHLGGKQDKDYYFDVRGDRDNLAFGCLYRMDIARFRRHELLNWSDRVVPSKSFRWDLSLYSEGDANGMDNKAKFEGRYYSIKYAALGRHKQLKHILFLRQKRSYINPEEFIPLTDVSTSDTSTIGMKLGPEVQESWEDQVIRKTKEFNKLTRDFPHDEKAWIAFAEYQDKIANMQSKKGARIQALEKKISILEKAAQLNPDNEELLLYLMKAYGSRDGGSVLVERWEKILMQHPGSCKLWKEFLCSCQSEFSRFKTSEMRKMYAHAIRALSATSMKLCRQAHQVGKVPNSVTELVQIEQGLVDIFVNLCRFEWQTGHQELATGLFQAEVDYSLFCPSLLLSEQTKLRLFEHFWNGNGARLGEDGAVGWGEWVEKEEENRQKAAMLEESIQESEQGGWTGWSEPKMKKSEISESPHEVLENALDDDNDAVQDPDSDDVPQDEEDLSALLEKVGIDIKTEADTDVTDVAIWKKWSEEEALRDAEQWMPLRENAETNGEEQLSRVIAFEDVGEYLFSLVSDDARLSLIFRLVDFFDGPIALWTSTNSPTWMEKVRSFEMLPKSTLKELWDVHDLMDHNKGNCSDLYLECLFDSRKDASKRSSVMKFLQNAMLLLLKVFPRNHILEEIALKSNVLFETRTTPSVNVITPCRGLAKSLLKNDRQDLLLCGVYARCEAAFGCNDIARKVFDMALSSIDGLPLDLQVNATFLYLWYAEMELGNLTSGSTSSPCLERAVHILTCLGTGAKYSPFKCEVPSTQLLRARQGFKDKIKALRSSWARGDVRDHSVALVSSAALFEELTAGWSSARGVFEDAFSMVLPERRSQSHQLESLFVYYIAILLRNLKQATLSRSWETILQGLHLYPYNPTIFAAFLKVGSLYTVPNKIRRILDDYCQKRPSVITWLSTFLNELGKEGSQHRIHGLFEKALGSDALQKSVMLWRCYLTYELHMCNPAAAKRVFFRAIHACPWSKKLWLDGFQRLSAFLTAKELADLQEVMRDKELNLRTDIYEILLQDEISS